MSNDLPRMSAAEERVAAAEERAAAAEERAVAEAAARAAAEERAVTEAAARAAAEVRAVAAEERADAVAARLGSLSLAGAAPAAPTRGATVRANLSVARERLASPSTASAACFLENAFMGVVAAPASVTVDAHAAAAFTAVMAACGGVRGMMQERACYALAEQHLPAFAERVGESGGDVTASALLSAAALRTAVWDFAPACKPELHVRSRGGGSGAAHTFRPAFNGELKTAGDGRALEQAAYYTVMDMVRVFFPASDGGVEPCARRFFAAPPLGFALVGFPHVGYMIAIEWIGKLLVSPASAPFILGSDAHAAAAAALPDVCYAAPVLLDDEALEWVTPAQGAARDKVAWCIAGGVFRKLVRGDARDAAAFSTMHAAYARLGVVLADAPPALRLPRFARLLYGAHEVLVEMPAVDGREAADEDVTRAGPLLDGIAAAIAWLAARRLVYTDLRGPNVLVNEEGGHLVDFDDCLATPAPVTTLAAYKAALAATPYAAAHGTFAAHLAAGALSDFEAALTAAFA